jgi:two-component system alkaline phosphatase synthesis response regulator PhoP
MTANRPRPKILMVEDDLTLANLYKMRMETEGFEVVHVANGEAALQTASKFQPNLILLDIMMPKLNGFDTLDILRQTPSTKLAKIIILTAMSQPNDQQRAMDLGADEYLVKSQVVIADVMSAIRRQLNLPASEK